METIPYEPIVFIAAHTAARSGDDSKYAGTFMFKILLDVEV